MDLHGPLAGKVALVTGASSGIGAAIAAEFAHAGATVVLAARNIERLEAVAARLDGHPVVQVADVLSTPAAERVCRETVEQFGRLDVLVNNAGGNLGGLGPLFAVSEEQAITSFRLNVVAPIAWARMAWEHSMAAHGGVVLNVSSLSGQHGSAGTGLYALSKAALDRVTAQLAWELGPRVRVVGIAPGMTETELTSSLVRRMGPVLHSRIPAGRIGTTDDVARLARFLVSDDAAWMSGVTIPLDGGETAEPLGAHLPLPADIRPAASSPG